VYIGPNRSGGTHLCQLRFDDISGQNQNEDEEGRLASQMWGVRHGREETVGGRNRLRPSSDHLLTAPDNDDNATSTSTVNSSSPYTPAPADNPTPSQPRLPAPTQPCPSDAKPDVDKRNESPVFRQGHVRRMQRSQEEGQGVHFVLKKSKTQAGAPCAFSFPRFTERVCATCRDKARPPPKDSSLYTT
jgi:hypothetical protein